MSDDRHFCGSHGWLVGASGFIPTAEFDHQTPALEMRVGCNRVHCTVCNAAVKQQVGFEVARGARIAKELYATDDWSGFLSAGKLVSHPSARLYVCLCRDGLVVGDTNLAPEEDMPEPTWVCAGHSALRLPAKLDGVALGESSDFAGLARAFFTGELLVKHPAIATWKADWLNRLYGVVLARVADTIGDAIFSLLGSDEVVVALGASTFFALHPDAKAAERLAPFFIEHRDQLEARQNPAKVGGSLRYWFLQAIAARLRFTRGADREALAIAKSEQQAGASIPPVLLAELRRR